jgi:hypothetical protein
MTHDPTTADPVALLARLTLEQVESRLRDLTVEEDALRILLRSLRARERARKRLAPANAEVKNVFDRKAVVDQLIESSGGCLVRGDDPRLARKPTSDSATAEACDTTEPIPVQSGSGDHA